MRHYVVYIPGLADKRYAWSQRAALFLWRPRIRAFYFTAHWANTRESFQHRLERLLKVIDHAHKKGYTVSLVSASAGSSLALVAFHKRTDVIHRVVSICGKLKHPETILPAVYAINPAFRESIIAYSRIEPTFTAIQRHRVLVVRATHDSYVPGKDGALEGAQTYTMRTAGHVFSIFMALTLYRRALIRFISKS